MLLVAVMSGCPGPAGDDPDGGVRLPQVAAGPREEAPSAVRDPRDRRLPEPLIDPAQLRPRTPPYRRPPAIDQPRFQRAGDVGWLAPAEPLLVLKVGYELRGYPLQLLLWHEVVNDTVGGTPVAVTYCPRCDSGVVFDRRVEDRVLSFAAYHRHLAGTLVLYDRQTGSLWPQLSERAALGMLTGTRLDRRHATVVAWRDFRDTYPDAWVLSRDTGHRRPYGRNPYPGYDDPRGVPPGWSGPDRLEARLPPMTRVVGVPGLSVTLVRSVLASSAVQPLSYGDDRLVAWHRPGRASPLDAGTVAAGRDIGTVAVFDAEVDGRVLHFAPYWNGFVDAETESWWNVHGHALHGPLAGRRLIPRPFLETYWFAWAAVHPGTQIAL